MVQQGEERDVGLVYRVWMSSSQLAAAFSAHQMVAGGEIAIVYQGTTESKKPGFQPIKNYGVKYRPPSVAVGTLSPSGSDAP